MNSLIALQEDESESMLPRNNDDRVGGAADTVGSIYNKKAGFHAVENRIWMS